jgi:hypothetical protein
VFFFWSILGQLVPQHDVMESYDILNIDPAMKLFFLL